MDYDVDIDDGEVATTSKQFRRPPGLPEKQISMDDDTFDSANELNPEDASLPSGNSDWDDNAIGGDGGDDDDDFNKSRDGESSAFLDVEDAEEEREEKYKHIERTNPAPLPAPDYRIREKDTDAGWFDLEDTDYDQKRKFKYIKKYNLRHRNYRDPTSSRTVKGVPSIVETLPSDDEEKAMAKDKYLTT